MGKRTRLVAVLMSGGGSKKSNDHKEKNEPYIWKNPPKQLLANKHPKGLSPGERKAHRVVGHRSELRGYVARKKRPSKGNIA